MEQKDIFSGLSVEKILADVKEMEGKQPLKLWSLADVDALLAEEDNEKNTPPSQAPENSDVFPSPYRSCSYRTT